MLLHKGGGQNIEVFNSEDETSERPILNKIYKKKIEGKKRNFNPTDIEINKHKKFINEMKNHIRKK